MSLPRTLAAAACCAPALALSCGSGGPGGAPVRRASQRVFVMGFDGMDPTLAQRFMDEGKLPNLKRLARQGSFATLGSTQPSESPTAWSSFASGVNPGKHDVYDFLVRDFDTYLPDLAMVRRGPPEFLWGTIPIAPPRAESTRRGTSFWVHAGRDGIRSVLLTIPVTWPPEEVAHGEMLGGLPLPDVRDTIGTFYYWATDLSSFEEGSTESGGYLKRLLFDGRASNTVLKGPENPVLAQERAALNEKRQSGELSDSESSRLEELETGVDIGVPIAIDWEQGSKRVTLEIQGQRIELAEGEWSDWVPLEFEVSFLVSIRGMTQFHVVEAGRELALYASPVNYDPRESSWIPLSTPGDFAKRLADQVGVYRTLGWAESADKALNDSRLDEGEFLYDSERAMDDREKLILSQLGRDDWDLFVAAVETTDRVSHMMWRLIDPLHPMYDEALARRYGDAIERVYRRADDLVGRLRERLPEDVVFMVMSDHGFHSFRRGVNLNTWLAENGYLVFEGQRSGADAIANLSGRGRFFEGVDWSRTRAYAVGLGQIYFNLRGRESRGIVSPGEEYAALQDEIREKLVTLVDPEDGARIFADVYERDDIYHGEYLRDAPDLQVGFNDGYRVGWQDTLGQIRRDVVEDNNRKWSGDHCATATEISGGVLFTSRPLSKPHPHITDLAPTVLELLEVPVPEEIDGEPVL